MLHLLHLLHLLAQATLSSSEGPLHLTDYMVAAEGMLKS